MTTVSGLDRALAAQDVVERLQGLDRLDLVELARRGADLPAAPAFRGRCLDADHLEAVASGAWSGDDQARLGELVDRLEALALPRVRRTDRRPLRNVLRGVALAVLAPELPLPGWPARRAQLLGPWAAVAGAGAGAVAGAGAPPAPSARDAVPAPRPPGTDRRRADDPAGAAP